MLLVASLLGSVHLSIQNGEHLNHRGQSELVSIGNEDAFPMALRESALDEAQTQEGALRERSNRQAAKLTSWQTPFFHAFGFGLNIQHFRYSDWASADRHTSGLNHFFVSFLPPPVHC